MKSKQRTMKQILLVSLLLVFSALIFPADVTPLPDVSKPDSIIIDNNQLILTEGVSIYIYSLKDFSLLKKFGKAGEGPEEFKITSYGGSGLFVDLLPKSILVTSVGKISIFNREGVFQSEIQTPFNFLGNRYLGLGNGFVGIGSAQEKDNNYLTLDIFDSKMKKIKEVVRWISPYNPAQKGTRVFTEPSVFQVCEDKIITAGGNELKVNVFDNSGKKLHSIQEEYKRIEVTQNYKDEVIKYFKTSPATKDVYQYIQPILFPDFFPAIRNLLVKDQKIYIITFKRKDQKSELFVFDLKGKLIKSLFVPIVAQSPIVNYPYSIKNGKLYQMLENEETENWDLHVTDIDTK